MTTPPERRPLRVLLVEDDADDAELVLLELKRLGYQPEYKRVQTAEQLATALSDGNWDVVLSDYAMPQFSAPDALAMVKRDDGDLPFVIISGTIGEETAVAALKAGAHDFLVKTRLARLGPALERELREAGVRRERRRAEQALKTSEERFRAIMETATDGVFAADADGIVTYMNPAAESMFGRAERDVVGQPWTLLMPTRYREPQREAVDRMITSEAAHSGGRTFELMGLRSDGSEFPIELSVGCWKSQDHAFFAGIVRDLSERKKVEAQLLVADRMVAVGTLAAGTAHEINNPLASVIANLDLALKTIADLGQRGVPTNIVTELLDELKDAREGAERVRDIVRDLRVFSRGEDEARGPVDVQRVMDSTLRMAWNEIRHRARLVKDYAPVPPVEASESRLGQVFLNIVVNAAQALPEGFAEANEIRVRIFEEDDDVIVQISDTGPGIPPEVMKHLYTPFVTTKPVGVGTGLGLSICYRIISGLGGKIGVDSSAKGTTFKLTLPRASLDTRPPQKPPSGFLRQPTRRGRVLVVDDEAIIGRVVKRALGSQHEVMTTTHARDALDLIEAGEVFDVILCDLMMPDMTGMDLYAAVVAAAPAQAKNMVFMTGGAFTQRAREFLDASPNQRIEKPFHPQHLRALVNDRIQ